MNDYLNKKNEFKNSEGEIDLTKLIGVFARNKKLIITYSIIGFVFASLYSLSVKRLWEGRFQIVLDNKEDPIRSLIADSGVSKLVSLENVSKTNELETQVAILESPSVLMPIFNFAIKQYKQENKKLPNFKSWKKDNLAIDLMEDTSILEIAYRDKRRDVILPVLNKISNAYQDYSTDNKKRLTKVTKDFLNSQINIYKIKSLNSYKSAQQFAIEQDLEISDSIFRKKEVDDSENYLGSVVSIETMRVNAANKIRNIDSQIKKINELGNDYEQLQYIGSTIPGLISEGLPAQLKQIETDLVDIRMKYTEKDRNVINLLKKRESTIALLKKRSIGYLKAEKLVQQAVMESAMRPKKVLIKYKELLRDAYRDEQTLIGLEDNLRKIRLEEAMTQEPWELITNPTLLDNPVAPSRKIIALLGLFSGFVLGFFSSLYKEKKSNLIFERKEIEDILFSKIIDEVKTINIKDQFKNLIFKDFVLSQKEEKFTFYCPHNKILGPVQEIKSLIFGGDSKNDKITIESSLNNINKLSNIILFLKYELTDINELKLISKKIQLYKLKLKGIILLKN